MASLTLSQPHPHLFPTISIPKPPSPKPSQPHPSLSFTAFNSPHIAVCITPSPPIQKRSIFAKVTKGKTPPPLTLKDQKGRPLSLSKFKGRPVVVYLYPADETPGCTKQACAFRDSYEKFKKAGAEVVGISGDSSECTSDEGSKVRKEWRVPSDLFGKLPGRETYVLDKNGVVQLVYNNQFQPEKHIDGTLKLLQSLK